MNFDFSDDQKLLKEQVRKFLADKCPMKVVRRVLDGNESFADEVWKGLVELGIPATGIPEAYGGAGADIIKRDNSDTIVSKESKQLLDNVFSGLPDWVDRL